jgi:uncharacterized protein
MPEAHSLPLCVFCRRRPVAAAWRPFCSERCKTRDLASWADGTYRVPGASLDPVDNVAPGSEEDSDE